MSLSGKLLFASALLIVLATKPAFAFTKGPDPEGVQPAEPLSHEVHLKQLENSTASQRKRLVGRYDEHLEQHRDDVVAKIERCKFILASAPESDYYADEEKAAPFDLSCNETLADAHPLDPAVIVLRASSLWGEELLAYATSQLSNADVDWPPKSRSLVLQRVADLHAANGALNDAARFAIEAQQADPSYDSSTVVARHLAASGLRTRAISALERKLPETKNGQALLEKAQLLLELDAPKAAHAAVIRLRESYPSFFIDPLFEGRVLEAIGDAAGARAAYAKQTGQWNQGEVLTRLFRLNLATSDKTSAEDSYRALREQGLDADAWGRHRMALSFQHPGSAWKIEDSLGLLSFAALLLGMFLLAGAALFPVHYLGLWRQTRGIPPSPTRWGLRHAWVVFSVMLVGDVIACYLFAYSELESWFTEGSVAELTQAELANAGVVGFGVTIGGALIWAKRHDLVRLSPRHWLKWDHLKRGLQSYLVVLAVSAFANGMIYLWKAVDAVGLTLSTRSVLEAIFDTHGGPVCFAMVVALVPVAEEFIFRGILLSALRRHLPFWGANLFQAVLFVALHDDMSRAIPLLTLALLAGRLTNRSGSIASATCLHAFNNLVAAVIIGVQS